MNFKQTENDKLWEIYIATYKELKFRGEITSKNIVGDIGEKAAVKAFSSTANLPRLSLAPPSTKNVDAIGTNGKIYSIKTISYPNKTTGVLRGFGSPEKPTKEKTFDYLIVVILDDYLPKEIYQFSFEDFYKFKRWHSTMKAYNISLTKEVLNVALRIL